MCVLHYMYQLIFLLMYYCTQNLCDILIHTQRKDENTDSRYVVEVNQDDRSWGAALTSWHANNLQFLTDCSKRKIWIWKRSKLSTYFFFLLVFLTTIHEKWREAMSVGVLQRFLISCQVKERVILGRNNVFWGSTLTQCWRKCKPFIILFGDSSTLN